jgi:YebC/PmpR family DNA-binding regulatory protein
MSGHSKWSTIKRKKGVIDAKRGQLFTKLTREIMVAARQGGPDVEMNFRLRLAVQTARGNNMPLDNIDRAVKRGAKVGEGAEAMEEALYEGYGPGGAAVLLQAVTDNPNRTASEVRNIFGKSGGNLGEPGCVAWNFESKGVIVVETSGDTSEQMALLAIDAGAEEFDLEAEQLEVTTTPDTFEEVRRQLEEAGASVVRAEVSMVPKSTVTLDSKKATQTLRLLDKLEELDDVLSVFTNADFPDDALEEYGNEG